MKNLVVFASALMIGAAAFAGSVPRVYQYTASLNTAVAKNAAKVTFTIAGEKFVVEDVCYRTKGKVTFKGAVIFGCDCVPDADLADGYPLVMLTSSEDKYQTLYVYAVGNILELGFEQDDVWVYNRIGNALSSKATVAELGFDTFFLTGLEDGCFRLWDLWHAGFGKSSIIDREDDTLDLSTVSGNVVGWALAPYCSAQDNNCPRCLDDDDCVYAIGFEPCEFEDPFDFEVDPDLGGVAYGTFSLKFNKTYSAAIKDIPEEDLEGTVEALVVKAFKQIKSEDQVIMFQEEIAAP
jgi:hypothetical protein